MAERKTQRVVDAARQLGVGRGTCYALVRSGDLRSVRVGRRILVPNDAVEDFLRRSIQS
jgi:excisionase family DNA binding protein